jgi:hypothetical protein
MKVSEEKLASAKILFIMNGKLTFEQELAIADSGRYVEFCLWREGWNVSSNEEDDA